MKAEYGMLLYEMFCLSRFGKVRCQTLNQIMKWEEFIKKYQEELI